MIEREAVLYTPTFLGHATNFKHSAKLPYDKALLRGALTPHFLLLTPHFF